MRRLETRPDAAFVDLSLPENKEARAGKKRLDRLVHKKNLAALKPFVSWLLKKGSLASRFVFDSDEALEEYVDQFTNRYEYGQQEVHPSDIGLLVQIGRLPVSSFNFFLKQAEKSSQRLVEKAELAPRVEYSALKPTDVLRLFSTLRGLTSVDSHEALVLWAKKTACMDLLHNTILGLEIVAGPFDEETFRAILTEHADAVENHAAVAKLLGAYHGTEETPHRAVFLFLRCPLKALKMALEHGLNLFAQRSWRRNPSKKIMWAVIEEMFPQYRTALYESDYREHAFTEVPPSTLCFAPNKSGWEALKIYASYFPVGEGSRHRLSADLMGPQSHVRHTLQPLSYGARLDGPTPVVKSTYNATPYLYNGQGGVWKRLAQDEDLG